MKIGTDVLQNNRFIKSIQQKNGRLRKRLFTVDEISSNYSDLQYAIIFSAKEAISKALQTGFNYGLSWQHINISLTNDNNNNIEVTLSGKADQLAGNKKVLVTASQSNNLSSTVALLVEGD